MTLKPAQYLLEIALLVGPLAILTLRRLRPPP
jgi:hypothetical protein